MSHVEIKAAIMDETACKLLDNGYDKEAEDLAWDLLAIVLSEGFEPGVY